MFAFSLSYTVDALPILPRMTWYECLCVPFICCRRKFNTNAAIIATTQRIISASEYGGGVSDYEFFATSYFLSNFRGGFLIEGMLFRSILPFPRNAISRTLSYLQIHKVLDTQWTLRHHMVLCELNRCCLVNGLGLKKWIRSFALVCLLS